jgi:hypothetical protein
MKATSILRSPFAAWMASVAGAADASAPRISSRRLAGSSSCLLRCRAMAQQGARLLRQPHRQLGIPRHQRQRVEQDDLVSITGQMFGDHAARGERDLALGRGAPEKHAHANPPSCVAHHGPPAAAEAPVSHA